MSIVESTGSLLERPAPVHRRSLRVVLSRAEVDLDLRTRRLNTFGQVPSPAHASRTLGLPAARSTVRLRPGQGPDEIG
jgi:hypothetical protein